MFKKYVDIGYRDGISILASFGWLNAMISLSAGILVIAFGDPLSSFQKVPVLIFFLAILILQLLMIPILRLLVKKFAPPPPPPKGETPDEQTQVTGFSRLLQEAGEIILRITTVMKDKQTLLENTLIVFFNVAINIWVIHLLFKSIDKPITLTLSTILAVTIRLSSLVELTPGNLGIREFVLGALSSGLGQGMAQGITVSMMWRLTAMLNKGILSLFVLINFKPGELPQTKKQEQEKENESEEREGIFLLGPSFPFRGGISHYNTILYNQLREKTNVMFYSFKKQYIKFLFPGKTDKDSSMDKIEPGLLPVENNNTTIKRVLHPINLSSWVKAGKEAKKYRLILLPWWVAFWAPYYLIFMAFAKNRKTKNKIVFFCHNVDEHERKYTGWLKRFIARVVLKKGDAFILHSSAQENQLARLLKNKTISAVVSPHPIYQVFNKNRYTFTTARESLQIPTGRKVILFFGFIRKYKGLEVLLKSLPVVKAYDPNILLLIVGEVWGGERHAVRYTQLIKKLDLESNTLFINRYIPNEEVELYFKACDFAVLPYIDGSGSGILQVAYGMDRPVVATNISAFRDVVEHGKTGLLVPPSDEHQMARAIIDMYESGGIPMMEEEVKEYKKQFDWSMLVEWILKYYGSLR